MHNLVSPIQTEDPYRFAAFHSESESFLKSYTNKGLAFTTLAQKSHRLLEESCDFQNKEWILSFLYLPNTGNNSKELKSHYLCTGREHPFRRIYLQCSRIFLFLRLAKGQTFSMLTPSQVSYFVLACIKLSQKSKNAHTALTTLGALSALYKSSGSTFCTLLLLENPFHSYK